jgi:pilus assembly protein CpaF
MATLHANSAREAITKLCTLPLLAGENVSSSFVMPTVAGAIDLIVYLRTTPSGQRRVYEIAALTGEVAEDQVVSVPLFGQSHGRLVRAEGLPKHADRFAAHGFKLASLLKASR